MGGIALVTPRRHLVHDDRNRLALVRSPPPIQPTRLELAASPQLGVVAPHRLDQPPGIVAPDEHLKLHAERE